MGQTQCHDPVSDQMRGIADDIEEKEATRVADFWYG